jgi:alkaline phosphatase D
MSSPPRSSPLDRRAFLTGTLACGLASCTPRCGPDAPAGSAPAVVPAEGARPVITHGVQSGDPMPSAMMVWSRCDRPARMLVEWSTSPSFDSVTRVEGPVATTETDFCARAELRGLPPGRPIHYRVIFERPDDPRARSEPALGSFRTPPADAQSVLLCWSGDTAGQGYGIDVARGGMKTYASMLAKDPHLFIHSGDQIYADNPIPEKMRLPDGSIWRNLVTPAKSKVAETLDEFRGNFAYNMLDEHVRRFNARVPSVVQWDDHEIHNNWFPGQVLAGSRYEVERRASVLAERARQAMEEYTPKRPGPIHRVIPYGPHLSIFVLDARSFRGPNGPNREEAGAAMLGEAQRAWLCEALATSRSTWKIIACDQPLGLVIPDGADAQEGFANGPGAPLGREREIAEVLRFIKERRVGNVLWVTADVHYAAAHHYDPARARFSDFDPFWELVAGPLHAGTFGPNELDETFGPEVRYRNVAPGEPQNRPPSDGKQSFGLLRVEGRTGVLTASLHDREGETLYSMELEPRG